MNGYLAAKSPNKWIYRELRDQYNKIGQIAGYATTMVLFNHVLSMVDALIMTNFHNEKKLLTNISVEPVLDINTKYGVGGIKFNYRF